MAAPFAGGFVVSTMTSLQVPTTGTCIAPWAVGGRRHHCRYQRKALVQHRRPWVDVELPLCLCHLHATIHTSSRVVVV